MGTDVMPESVEGTVDTTSAGASEGLLDTSKPTDEQETPVAESTGEGDQETSETAEGDSESAVPEEYAEFSMPEGLQVDGELLARANPVFKELGLSQEQAQKLVDLKAAEVLDGIEKFHQQRAEWAESCKTDKEIGGEHFHANIGLAQKALNTYFDPTALEVLKSAGLDNHPDVIRGLVRIGKQHLMEDQPGNSGSAAIPEKSRAERFYGKS